jgi:NitT/TauT family transport system substrate-binding protein
MIKRTIMVTALVAGMLVFFNGGQQESAGPIRVAVPFSVSSIPVLTLNGKTIAGHRVDVSVFQDHSLTLAEFLRGDIDILMTGFTQGTAAFAGNRNVRHAATLVWGVSSIMVRDAGLKNLEGLAGKSLGVPFAKSPLDLQTRVILEARGLAGKVSLEYAPPQQALALLLAGKLDAAALPEPLPSQLEAAGKAFRLARYQDLWKAVTGGEARSPQVSLFVLEPFAGSHAGFMNGFIAAVAASTAAVTADPAQAAAARATDFKLTPEIVKTGLDNTLLAVPPKAETRSLIMDYLKRLALPPPDAAFFYGE